MGFRQKITMDLKFFNQNNVAETLEKSNLLSCIMEILYQHFNINWCDLLNMNFLCNELSCTPEFSASVLMHFLISKNLLHLQLLGLFLKNFDGKFILHFLH